MEETEGKKFSVLAELMRAALFYQVCLDLGYTESEIKIKIGDEVFIVVSDGNKQFIVSTGFPQLSEAEMMKHWDFLLKKWKEIPENSPGKTQLRAMFEVESFRLEAMRQLEAHGMIRHRVSARYLSTALN